MAISYFNFDHMKFGSILILGTTLYKTKRNKKQKGK